MELSEKLTTKLENLDLDTKTRLFYRLRLKELNEKLNEILISIVNNSANEEIDLEKPNTDAVIDELTEDGSINFYRRYILHNLYDDASNDSKRYKNLIEQLTSTHRAYDYFDTYTLKAYNVYYARLVKLFRHSSATKFEICYLSDRAKDYTLNEYVSKQNEKFHQFDFNTTDALKIPKEIDKDNRLEVMKYLKEQITKQKTDEATQDKTI